MNVTAALPGQVLAFALPFTVDASARARDLVRSHATDLPPALLDDLTLVASELTSNAVRYGLPDVMLELRLAGPHLGVSVTDRGPGDPHLPATPAGTAAPSGRGLLLIERVGFSWGVTPLPGAAGKTVWSLLRPS